MELFSEIYSCYYKVVEKILLAAMDGPLSKEDMTKIIHDNAFSESSYYILPKLINDDWNLMVNHEGKYTAKPSTIIKRPMTSLEKAWIKSLLSDKRIKLFLSDVNLYYLKEQLVNVEPLFDPNDFYYFDTYSDGDDYGCEKYIENFHKVLSALKSRETIAISFESGKSGRITGNYMPIKLEYSIKDDKFRVYVARVRYGKLITTAKINLSRISHIEPSTDQYKGELHFDRYMEANKCKEPVVIEISKERNALERCMLHFASYEKRTEYVSTSDKYISYIYYDKQDETELLIRILSFGPVIKVLGPENFLKLVKDRVRKQAALMNSQSLEGQAIIKP